MIKCLRINSDNADFQKLVKELDAYLAVINGSENPFFAQYNKIDSIQHVVVAYEENTPVGCGAIKEYATGTMEVKRMFVPQEKRGRGIASAILRELESWAKELNYNRCILETSEVLRDAIRLYENRKYLKIPNYGQYENVKTSLCFEKKLS
jgi:putative acetyltransferase